MQIELYLFCYSAIIDASSDANVAAVVTMSLAFIAIDASIPSECKTDFRGWLHIYIYNQSIASLIASCG